MLRLGGRKACLFYDSGSNGNLISGALAEELLMKVVDDRPTGIGTAGAGGAWTFYGSYVLGLGPDQEGNYYRISAQGMRCVTDKFTKYDLHPINKELKHLLGEPTFPKPMMVTVPMVTPKPNAGEAMTKDVQFPIFFSDF